MQEGFRAISLAPSARCISSGQLFPRKPSPISAREERWRLDGLDGLDGLCGLGVDWTNMGRESGMPLDRPPAMFASPGRACTLPGSHMSDYGDDEALTASNGPSASAMLGPITQWLRS